VEPFPFTEAEWAAVKDATLRVVNAELAENPALRTSHWVRCSTS
jgi:hypothetical protein